MKLIPAVVIVLALAGGCAADDAPRPAAATSTSAPPTTTTVHPFYETFPELLDAELQGGGNTQCPAGDGSGSETGEWDFDAVREDFEETPEAYATDPVGAVILRFERFGQADPTRLDGMRQWFRVDGPDVILPIGPDDESDRYVLRAGLHIIDDRIHVLEWMTSCNFLWRPLPTE